MTTTSHLAEALLGSVGTSGPKVTRAAVGLHWTAVASDHVGMSHTYKTGRKVELEGSGDLEGGSALEMARRILSWEPLEASLGVAALNSMIGPMGEPGNVKDLILERAPGRTVTVIGRFPFNDEVRKAAATAYFLEMEPDPRKGELPASAAEKVIPRSDITVITATALINHTLERLLQLTGERLAIVLGPSTPMTKVLFDFGADVIAGVRVVDADALFRSITHGAKKFSKLAGTEAVFLEKK